MLYNVLVRAKVLEECYNKHYIFIFRKEAIMERIQDLVYTHVQGGQFRWVTVSTLMLALGTILHLVSPSVAGVTPNWTIATYCVAILLTRPSLSQTLGIGLVAALINVLTSKSAFPYGNLLSEPGGALTAALVTRAMLSVKFRKIGGFDLTPIVSGFYLCYSLMASAWVAK